jgi:CheY-like chemotaxis protein
MEPVAAAIAVLTDGGPADVVVTGIGMPGADGYALLRESRALPIERGGACPRSRSPPTRRATIGAAR